MLPTPIPNPVGDFGAVTVNGTIYAIGSNFTANLAFNYMYDPFSDTWTSKTPPPITGGTYTITAYQGKIYAFGGNTVNNQTITSTLVYDCSTDSWTAKSAMPTPRLQMQSNLVNNKIYLIGGTSTKRSQTATVNINEAYNPLNDSWTEMASSPVPITMYTSAVFENKIYLFGGFTTSSVSDKTQIYDTATNTWSLGEQVSAISSPTWLGGMSAAATTGLFAPARIYLIGGSSNFQTRNLTQIYDPIEDNWTTGAPMPAPRADTVIANINDTLYVIGGTDTRTLQQTILITTNEEYIRLGYKSNSSIPEFSAFELTALILLAISATSLVLKKYYKPN
jgi:N-acetylneuraminic acid mutarotase